MCPVLTVRGADLVGKDWVQLTGSAWTPRGGAAAAVLSSGHIVVVAGELQTPLGTLASDVHLSADGGRTWSLVTANGGFGARRLCQAVVLPDDSIVIGGGIVGVGTLANDVWRSVDSGRSWEEQTTSAGWKTRFGFGLVALPNSASVGGADIVLIAGHGSATYGDVWRSSDGGKTWLRLVQVAEFGPRYRFGAAVQADARNTIFVVGGVTSSSAAGVYLNDVWSSTDGVVWTQVTASAAFPPRTDPVLVGLPDGGLLMASGSKQSTYFDDTYHSADGGATWTLQGESQWPRRGAAMMVALPDKSVVIMGGKWSNRYGDVWASSPYAPSSGWGSAHCSSRKRALCTAEPSLTRVAVSLPSGSAAISPSVVGASTVAFASPPVPVVTLAASQLSVTASPVVEFETTFDHPVLQLEPSWFAVQAELFDAIERTVSVEGDSWTLTVTGSRVAPTQFCPPGFARFSRAVGSNAALLCARANETRASWDDHQHACAPHSLVSLLATEHAFFALDLVAWPRAQYWYVAARRCSLLGASRFALVQVWCTPRRHQR